MKCASLAIALISICTATSGIASPDASASPQQVSMPPQRAGDLIVQGSIAPAWLVPAQAPPASIRPGPAPMASVAAAAVAAPVERPAPPPRRTTSAEWRTRIDVLAAEIEARKAELGQARESLVRAVDDEAREANEQYLAAQRRAEEMKRQAEKAAAAAQASRPAPPPAAIAAIAPAQKIEEEIVFALRRSDRTIPAALTRWAEEARFNLLWEGKGEDKDPKVSFEDSYRVTFPDAVHRVVTSLNSAGSDLLMCEYTNRVVRVVPRSATCRVNRNIQQNMAEGAVN